MVIAIQQPEHLPWLGFFNKMAIVDEFIYLDNVQFKKRYFENRNKIKAANKNGWEWLTVPVVTKDRYTQDINEVEIDYTQDWQRKYINKIRQNYGESRFFPEIFAEIEIIINKRFNRLFELNLALINFFKSYLGILTPAILASSFSNGKGSDLILDLCLKRKADTYLSGPDGRNYLLLEAFQRNKIRVEYHDYVHPVYTQKYGPFISHMSIVDLIFNYGSDSKKIIRNE